MLIIELRVGVPARPFALHKVRLDIDQQRRVVLYLNGLFLFFTLFVLFDQLLDGGIHGDDGAFLGSFFVYFLL